MAADSNNQKISEIRVLPPYVEFPLEYGFQNTTLLEHTTLLMLSQTFLGGVGKTKKRDMSTRFTYGELYRILLRLLLAETGKSTPYTFSGQFNFATHGVNLFCANEPENGSPGGRHVVNYNQCQTWFNAAKSNGGSGFAATLKNIGYQNDHTNPDYDPNL